MFWFNKFINCFIVLGKLNFPIENSIHKTSRFSSQKENFPKKGKSLEKPKILTIFVSLLLAFGTDMMSSIYLESLYLIMTWVSPGFPNLYVEGLFNFPSNLNLNFHLLIEIKTNFNPIKISQLRSHKTMKTSRKIFV